jgi:hypothetical protein
MWEKIVLVIGIGFTTLLLWAGLGIVPSLVPTGLAVVLSQEDRLTTLRRLILLKIEKYLKAR